MNKMKNIEKLIASWLSGNIPEEEEKRLAEWRESSPENEKLFQDYRKIWDHSFSGNEWDTEAALGKIHEKIKNPSNEGDTKKEHGYRLFKPLMIAAVIILFVISSIILMFVRQEPVQLLTIKTGSEKTEVLLKDGTRVWINKHTTFNYPDAFSGKERKVYLDGEAYFEVAKNSKMPFIVETGGYVTRVLGTSFNVRAYTRENEIKVSVAEGNVAVKSLKEDKSAEGVHLSAGEAAFVDKNHSRITKSSIQGQNVFSWKTETIEFRNTPLEKVTKEISEIYDTSIQVLQPALKELKYTGTFDSMKLEEIIGVLELTLELKHEKDSTGIVLKQDKALRSFD